MNFSNFLIASDLDGTFLNKKGEVVQRNLDAIARFNANGGCFTLNTGRPHITIEPTTGDPTKIFNAPCSHCNGAYLYDFRTKEYFFEELLSPTDTADLIAFAKQYCPDIASRANAREQIRFFVPDGVQKPRAVGTEEGIVVYDLPLKDWPMNDWYKMVFVGDPDRILQVRRDFEHVFGERFGKTTSSARALEVQLPHSSKAVGIDKMRKLTPELGARTIIACGDYENDIPMLKAADIAVCPANALDEVKEICDLVLCHCDEGLIGDIVEAIEAEKIRPKQK